MYFQDNTKLKTLDMNMDKMNVDLKNRKSLHPFDFNKKMPEDKTTL